MGQGFAPSWPSQGMAVRAPKPRIWKQGAAWVCQPRNGWIAGFGDTPIAAFLNFRLNGIPRNG